MASTHATDLPNNTSPKSGAATEAAGAGRDPALDISRGLIVALMALDHVRIFFSGAQFDPGDVDATTPGWFFTRFVTHLCAPGFYFLAGMSAALMERRGMAKADVSRFLVTRGAILILLEILVFGFAWSFNPGWFWFGVIAGLGAAMILLAGALWAPRAALLVGALAFTLLHDALWSRGLAPQPLNSYLYYGGRVELPLVGPRIVLYSLLPWAALMLLGYASASWLMPGGRPARRRFLIAGLGGVAAFVALRLFHIGERRSSFEPAGGWPHDLLSFLDIEKYPVSLQFALATLGLLALFMAAVSGRRPGLLGPLNLFGRVPFFFYFLHIFLIHSLAVLTALLLGWPLDYLRWTSIGPNLAPPDGYGFGLAGIYAAWLLVLALLYPVCLRYAQLRAERPGSWLRYF